MATEQVTVEQILASLDIPCSRDLRQSTAEVPGHDVWRWASRQFTTSMAKERWLLWNPEQAHRAGDPHFMEYFRRFLTDGLELGYRLDRFRELALRLPDPDERARNWISFFEEATTGDDCCAVRMFLSREQQQVLLARNHGIDGTSWDEMLSMMNDGLFYELGLVYRPPSILVDDSLAAPWFRCEWNDLRLPPQRGLDDQHVLVNDTVDRLTLLKIKGEESVNPANGSEFAIIDKSQEAIAKKAGLSTWDSRGYAILALSATIRRAAAALVNRSLYDLYILRLRDVSPDLVSSVQSAIDPNFLVQILRGLLAEEISVRDLSAILEAALELRATIDIDMSKYIVFCPPTGGVFPVSGSQVSDLMPTDYVEFIRARRKRYISHKYTRGGNTLLVYLMDPRSEELLAKPAQLDAAAETSIMNAVREEIGRQRTSTQNFVILTTVEVRRTLHRLVSLEFPFLAVLSYQELSPDMNIQPIARITPKL